MENGSKQFLKDLVTTPGVSGYEQPVQQVVREYVKPFSDHLETDLHGNVIATVNPGEDVRVMLAGHCDQIGLVVSHIDDNGFLFSQTVGGWDPQQLVGQRMTVWGSAGPINGVISKKAIHLQDESERKQVAKTKELWIDIGAKSKSEADDLVTIGDSVTLKLGFQELRNNLANSPAMDNRTGVWVVMEALRLAKFKSIGCSLHSVSTVQEEIGLRGAKTAAYGIDPQIGIAVDVTHATDCPGVDDKQQGIINLGNGPVIYRGPNVNPRIYDRLIQIADNQSIPYQLAALGRAASNDSNSLQITRSGVATGLVAIPNRYMHSAVETVSLDDIVAAATLLAEFVGTVADVAEFIP